MMKKIIYVLVLLLFVGTLLISGCSPTAPSDNGGTSQINSELGINDLNNDVDTVDADDSDFDLTDVDNVGTDLGDM